MAAKLLIDENARDGKLWSAILTWWPHYQDADIIRVGDQGAPACGTLDPQVLEWAIAADRTLVTLDVNTMISYHSTLAITCQTTGLLILKRNQAYSDLAQNLLVFSCIATTSDIANQYMYIPNQDLRSFYVST
jgi:hypothetical protein